MGMTMTQKILAAHAGLDTVEAGQLIEAKLDIVMANDITGPMALPIIRQMSDKVFDKDKVVFVPDHFTPNKDIKSAENSKAIREYAKEQGLKWYFEQGKSGVEHAILPEAGVVTAGECIIGADSHTCTYGALGAFSTGMGTTDVATGMATGEIWFKVPSAIKFVLTGKPGKYVSGKDIIIHIIGKIGVDGALYKSMEFTGDGIGNLSMDDRFTMANMAIEAGAKNGIFPVDEKTVEYLDAHCEKPYTVYEADEDAVYDDVVEIDLSKVRPTVAFPHLPGNAKTIDEIEAEEQVKIDQVVIGSCTNGRMEDMRKAAAILKGHTVHPDVRVMVVPATQKIYKQCIKEGLLDIFVDAGCAVNTPSCGPCMGGHMGVMAAGEKCVSTTNRNFVGRMGHVDSLIYLASPEVAAASAIKGYIANPEKISCRRRGRFAEYSMCRAERRRKIMRAHGHVFKYGDNVDTDVIIPARYLNSFDAQELASHAMADIDPDFVKKVQSGDIIVANKNFGCGSSREHAPLCLKTAGVSCIIAETFARIFYRNAINIGLPIIECPEAAQGIEAGDEVEVDFDSGMIYNRTKGTEFKGQPLPEFMQKLIAAGGLVNYTNSKKK